MTAFLDEKLTQCSISRTELAEILSLDETTLEEKINGSIQWKLAEAVQICSLLHTTDVEHLFSN